MVDRLHRRGAHADAEGEPGGLPQATTTVSWKVLLAEVRGSRRRTTSTMPVDVELSEDDQICTICAVLGRPPQSFLEKVQMENVRRTLEQYPQQV